MATKKNRKVKPEIKATKPRYDFKAAQEALFERGFRCVYIDPRSKVENWSKDGVSFHIGPHDVSIQSDILPYDKLNGEFEYMLFLA